MPNIGYADNFWGRTPPCWFETDKPSKAAQIEDDFDDFGRDEMIAQMKSELDAQDWADCQENLEQYARSWFYDSLRGSCEYSDLNEWRDEYCDFSRI